MSTKLFTEFEEKKVLILGFGKEGYSTYKILREEFPEKVIGIADEKRIDEFDAKEKRVLKNDKNISLFLGRNYLDSLETYEVIIKSPGIPSKLSKLSKAIESGILITSQTKIFFERCKGRIIGVTGTKGKSTTSSLIHEILKGQGFKSYLVGNIEKPALNSISKRNTEEAYFVYELSSHQLDDLTKSPHIAVILNIGTDHLDWHGTRENYIQSKLNIVKYQNKNDFFIGNYDDDTVRKASKSVISKKYFFGLKNKTNSGQVRKNKLVVKSEGKEELVIDVKKILLKGEHNWLNTLAAGLVSSLLNLKKEETLKSIYSYGGLEHRLEEVREIKGRMFINDSISTNPTSFLAAINSFSKPLTLIMGGYDRGLKYDEMFNKISERKNIKNIILIGELSKTFSDGLKEYKFGGKVVRLKNKNMNEIVEKAMEETESGGIVLLSPAAASFDMFENYKKRGEKFKAAVSGLK